MKKIDRVAKVFIAFMLLIGFGSSLSAQIREYDLSNITTVKDAESYYGTCSSMLYKDNLNEEDLLEIIHRLYALGKRLGMSSMDHKDIREYECRVAAPYDDDKHKLESVRFRTVYLYKSLQQILWPYGKPISNVYWSNFVSDHLSLALKIARVGEEKHGIIWFEYYLKGIRFVLFKNSDENFAYDLKITCLTQNNQKTETEITLMPYEVKVISSTVAPGNQPYAIPQKYEISNKYYIGKQ